MSKIDTDKNKTYPLFSVQIKLIVKDPTVSVRCINSNYSAVPLHSFVSKVVDGV